MSIDLSFLLAMLFETTPSAVVLSVCIGVGGCLCPISSRVCCAGIASRQLMESASSSASAAEDMIVLITCDVVSKEPLFGG